MRQAEALAAAIAVELRAICADELAARRIRAGRYRQRNAGVAVFVAVDGQAVEERAALLALGAGELCFACAEHVYIMPNLHRHVKHNKKISACIFCDGMLSFQP